MKKYLFKSISIIIAVTLIVTSVTSNLAYAMPISPNMPTVHTIPQNQYLVPFNIGRITDALYNGDDKEIVINIQDLHSHEQTQRNISSILSILDSKYGLDSIYVEGATGPLNTEWLSNIKDARQKEQVLNNLLNSGRLTGGEYFAVKSNKNNVLQGLEDSKVYAKNFERLNNIYNKEIEIKNYVSVLTNLLKTKSEQYYSKENKKINRIVKAYKNGKIGTYEYIESLLKQAQKTNINLTKYKNIIIFAQVISKQKQFKSKKLNAEIKELLVEIKDKTSFKEYKSLVEKSSKKELEVEFYFDLLKKAQDLNVLSQNKYKNANIFFEYLTINQKLNTIELANDEKIFLQELKSKLATTENERNIYFLQNYLESLSNYLTNKMSATEYESFISNLDKFKMLWAKYIDIDNITSITEYFSLVEDFYKDNVERNKIFIKKLFGKEVSSPQKGLRIKNSTINHQEKVINEIINGKKIHVVITGGFHTYGFNKLLEDEGINYIVITPNITDATTKAETLYKNVFNEEYQIANTTFANRPITEIKTLLTTLNNEEIDTVKAVDEDVEIVFKSGNIYRLPKINSEKMDTSTDILSQEQAEKIVDVILEIQKLKQLSREISRGDSAKFDLNKIEKLIEKIETIDNTEIKNKFIPMVTELNVDTDVSGKLMLPSTRIFLSVIFKFIKNENVKNRIMSVTSAILETLLFPLIIISPRTFTLLHYSKNARRNIKSVLYDLDKLYEIRNLLTSLEELSKKGAIKTQVYKQELDNLSKQLSTVTKNITNINTDDLENEIRNREAYLEKVGYTQRLNATKEMIKTGLGGAFIILGCFFYMLISTILESNNSMIEIISSIQVKNVTIDTFIAFLVSFTGYHALYNLNIDSKKSKSKKELKKVLYDLISFFPNDINYANDETLKEDELYVVFYDIINLFNEDDSDFFNKYYTETTTNTLAPLTYLEILKGFNIRGDNIDSNIYNKNIEYIIEKFSKMSSTEISRIIGNIEATLHNPNISEEGRVFLLNYRKAIKNLRTKYWNLSIASSKAESKSKEIKQKNTYVVTIKGSKYFTKAVSIREAFDNVVYRLAINSKLKDEPIEFAKKRVQSSIGYESFMENLEIRYLSNKKFKNIKEKNAYRDYLIENFCRKFVTQADITISKVVNKNKKIVLATLKGNPREYFDIKIPGINDTDDLSIFQKVKAFSPRQAIYAVVYAMCVATDNHEIKDGYYEGTPFSQTNATKISEKLSKKYSDDDLWKIMPTVKPNKLSSVVKSKVSQTKETGRYYRVVIPEFNDSQDLSSYQYVYAENKKEAIEKAVLAIIKAKEREEIYGGYYNYKVINKKNKQAIIDSILSQYKVNDLVVPIKKSSTTTLYSFAPLALIPLLLATSFSAFQMIGISIGAITVFGTVLWLIDWILNLLSTPDVEQDYEKSKIKQNTISSDIENLTSQLTNTEKDVALKVAIEAMYNAGFEKKYIETLISQYVKLRIDSVPETILLKKDKEYKFGTAGIRGIMGEEFDFLDVAIVTQAIADVIVKIAQNQNIEKKDIKVLVGGDSRLFSRQFSEIAAKILSANGIKVTFLYDETPSPAISYYTKEEGYTLSINITGSHNTKEQNGYKITLGDGGQAGLDETTLIENAIKNIQDNLDTNSYDSIIKLSTIKFDLFLERYADFSQMEKLDIKNKFIETFIKMITSVFGINDEVKFSEFKEKTSKWTIVVDPKNGATKKYYYEILKYFGFNVVMMNDTDDPTFGGQKPEPSYENTEQLRKKVSSMKQEKLLGASTDVDGDRFGVVDGKGNFISANEIGTILLNYRLTKLLNELVTNIQNANGNIEKQNEILKKFVNRKIIVPRNCATTHALDDLVTYLVNNYYSKLEGMNLDKNLLEQFKKVVDVKEINVGFKYFAQAKHEAEKNGDLFLLGVESSGGISIAEWIYDKCGFLANIMTLLVLVEYDKQPQEILENIYSKIGYVPESIETSISFRELVENEGNITTLEEISNEAKARQTLLMDTVNKLKENENSQTVKNLFTDVDSSLVIKEIRNNDGIKIIFENGSWLLIRPSGTEPIIRIFDETKGNEELSQKLVSFVSENGGINLLKKITESEVVQQQTQKKAEKGKTTTLYSFAPLALIPLLATFNSPTESNIGVGILAIPLLAILLVRVFVPEIVRTIYYAIVDISGLLENMTKKKQYIAIEKIAETKIKESKKELKIARKFGIKVLENNIETELDRIRYKKAESLYKLIDEIKELKGLRISKSIDDRNYTLMSRKMDLIHGDSIFALMFYSDDYYEKLRDKLYYRNSYLSSKIYALESSIKKELEKLNALEEQEQAEIEKDPTAALNYEKRMKEAKAKVKAETLILPSTKAIASKVSNFLGIKNERARDIVECILAGFELKLNFIDPIKSVKMHFEGDIQKLSKKDKESILTLQEQSYLRDLKKYKELKEEVEQLTKDLDETKEKAKEATREITGGKSKFTSGLDGKKISFNEFIIEHSGEEIDYSFFDTPHYREIFDTVETLPNELYEKETELLDLEDKLLSQNKTRHIMATVLCFIGWVTTISFIVFVPILNVVSLPAALGIYYFANVVVHQIYDLVVSDKNKLVLDGKDSEETELLDEKQKEREAKEIEIKEELRYLIYGIIEQYSQKDKKKIIRFLSDSGLSQKEILNRLIDLINNNFEYREYIFTQIKIIVGINNVDVYNSNHYKIDEDTEDIEIANIKTLENSILSTHTRQLIYNLKLNKSGFFNIKEQDVYIRIIRSILSESSVSELKKQFKYEDKYKQSLTDTEKIESIVNTLSKIVRYNNRSLVHAIGTVRVNQIVSLISKYLGQNSILDIVGNAKLTGEFHYYFNKMIKFLISLDKIKNVKIVNLYLYNALSKEYSNNIEFDDIINHFNEDIQKLLKIFNDLRNEKITANLIYDNLSSFLEKLYSKKEKTDIVELDVDGIENYIRNSISVKNYFIEQEKLNKQRETEVEKAKAEAEKLAIEKEKIKALALLDEYISKLIEDEYNSKKFVYVPVDIDKYKKTVSILFDSNWIMRKIILQDYIKQEVYYKLLDTLGVDTDSIKNNPNNLLPFFKSRIKEEVYTKLAYDTLFIKNSPKEVLQLLQENLNMQQINEFKLMVPNLVNDLCEPMMIENMQESGKITKFNFLFELVDKKIRVISPNTISEQNIIDVLQKLLNKKDYIRNVVIRNNHNISGEQFITCVFPTVVAEILKNKVITNLREKNIDVNSDLLLAIDIYVQSRVSELNIINTSHPATIKKNLLEATKIFENILNDATNIFSKEQQSMDRTKILTKTYIQQKLEDYIKLEYTSFDIIADIKNKFVKGTLTQEEIENMYAKLQEIKRECLELEKLGEDVKELKIQIAIEELMFFNNIVVLDNYFAERQRHENTKYLVNSYNDLIKKYEKELSLFQPLVKKYGIIQGKTLKSDFYGLYFCARKEHGLPRVVFDRHSSNVQLEMSFEEVKKFNGINELLNLEDIVPVPTGDSLRDFLSLKFSTEEKDNVRDFINDVLSFSEKLSEREDSQQPQKKAETLILPSTKAIASKVSNFLGIKNERARDIVECILAGFELKLNFINPIKSVKMHFEGDRERLSKKDKKTNLTVQELRYLRDLEKYEELKEEVEQLTKKLDKAEKIAEESTRDITGGKSKFTSGLDGKEISFNEYCIEHETKYTSINSTGKEVVYWVPPFFDNQYYREIFDKVDIISNELYEKETELLDLEDKLLSQNKTRHIMATVLCFIGWFTTSSFIAFVPILNAVSLPAALGIYYFANVVVHQIYDLVVSDKNKLVFDETKAKVEEAKKPTSDKIKINKKFILLGAPGSGKGTFAQQLVDKYETAQISTGNLLREARKNNPIIKDIQDRGDLVPDNLVLDLLKDEIARLQAKGINSFIFDGFPRNAEQTKVLLEFFKEQGWENDVEFIHIDVSLKEVKKRLGGRVTCDNKDCGASYSLNNKNFAPKMLPDGAIVCPKCGSSVSTRSDDTEKGIEKRYAVYSENRGSIVNTCIENGFDVQNVKTPAQAMKFTEHRLDTNRKINFYFDVLYRPINYFKNIKIVLEYLKNKTIEQKKNKVKDQKINVVGISTKRIRTLVSDAIKALQKLTYSVLFKNSMEYTIVANATDLARVEEARLLSKQGIKVNLVLLGNTNLVKETSTRISTEKGELAYCLIDTPNKNLSIYGCDDKATLEDSQIVKLNEQSALLGLLKYVNDNSSKTIKILDLPNNLSNDIITTEVEENAKGMFTTIGVGKNIINLFVSALQNKLTSTNDMIIKPSLVASNLSKEDIDGFGIDQISRFKEQGITTIIVSIDDEFLQNKTENIKNLLQIAHSNGIKVMFNYSFDLESLGLENFIKQFGKFDNTIQQFKENGGIDGLQIDISKSGNLSNSWQVLYTLMEFSKVVEKQNIGSFLSVKMPETIHPSEYSKVFEHSNIKLVADYDSPILSSGISMLNSENVIVNISADKNGIVTLGKLSDIFEKNKVSMIAFDSSILEKIDTTESFNLQEISITKLISSLFETTPDGQTMKGINKGRSFVLDRNVELSSKLLKYLYDSYISDDLNVKQLNIYLCENLRKDISKYELKGFVLGILEVSELQKVKALDITFDKSDYTNLLMKTLVDYRILEGNSFNTYVSTDIGKVLVVEKFREEFRPQIVEIYNVLNGNYENKVDSIISMLSALKDNLSLTSEERSIVLEGLLLFLLGYAKQDKFDIDNITDDKTISTIKALLSAA